MQLEHSAPSYPSAHQLATRPCRGTHRSSTASRASLSVTWRVRWLAAVSVAPQLCLRMHIHQQLSLGAAGEAVGDHWRSGWWWRPWLRQPPQRTPAVQTQPAEQLERPTPPRSAKAALQLEELPPARPFPSSVFLDKNRRDIGKSQSIWTDFKMETAGSRASAPQPSRQASGQCASAAARCSAQPSTAAAANSAHELTLRDALYLPCHARNASLMMRRARH
jgi:hypothetical protein